MALIEWREEFEIGIPSVDYEHRMLIELINELHSKLAGVVAKESVPAFLGEIHTRISAHFALEERAMRELKYGNYAEHKTDHELLLDEIRDIMDAYEADAYAGYERELSGELQSWFGGHFRDQDAPLHAFLEQRGKSGLKPR